jgi:uncharacterized membrane protein YphA (DoxX/SURF4 family)
MNRVSLTQVRTAFLRIAIGLLLILAGIAKAMSPLGFYAALNAAEWLPHTLSGLLVIGVPVVEVALGVGLLIGWKVRATAILSFILMALFTGFLLIETARGNNINCGCFGESNGLLALLNSGSGALIRNGLLLLMAASLIRSATSSDRWSIDGILCSYER